MNKHTPGPWRAKENGFYRVAVVDRDGNYLTYKAGTDRMPDPEREANANLIAAAPELLDALEVVVAIADRDTEEFNTARAIIAKAKGITQ